MKFLIRNSKFLILSTVILFVVLGPLGAHWAQAAWFDIASIASSGIKQVFAWIGYLILQLVSLLLALTGHLLDVSIGYSINNFAETSKAIVETGWGICRDIANLFFIFILLYISIATILQLSEYGMKKLLATVIIVALMVNFSLMITGFIIDGSNILALEFYNKITHVKDSAGKIIEMSPSAIIAGAFEPQTLFEEADKGCTEWSINPSTGLKYCTKEEIINPIFKAGDEKGEVTLVNIFIITIMGSILFAVLAFIFFAAAVLFILRTVVLWLLMILSPLAFMAMALPAAKEYASKWWKELFNQVIFAPVYLFLLYLVISIVSSGAITKGLGLENEVLSSAFLNPASNINLILKFVTMIVLTTATLVIAKQMGAAGATTVSNWGNSLKGASQKYAGRLGKRYTGRAADWAREKLEGEGRVAGTLRQVPFLQRGVASVAQLKKKEVGTFKKDYGGYDTKTLQQLRDKIGTPKEGQAAIDKIIEEREKKKKEDEILETGSSLERTAVLAKRAKEDKEQAEKIKTEKPAKEKPEAEKKP